MILKAERGGFNLAGLQGDYTYLLSVGIGGEAIRYC